MTSFTRTWNAGYEGSPADSQAVALGATRIREVKVDIRQRLDVDHIMDNADDDGRHRNVYMFLRSADLSPVEENSRDYLPFYVTTADSNPNGQWKLVTLLGDEIPLNAGNDPYLLTTVNAWQMAQKAKLITLTDAATIAVDASLGNMYRVTLGGNRTLGSPTNLTQGWTATVYIRQDGTGGRTLNFHADYKFSLGIEPDVTEDAGALDILTLAYDGITLVASFSRDHS